jgi:hypothetical protein
VRAIFGVTALFLVVFGAGFVLAEALVFGSVGVTLDAGGALAANVAGSAVVALGVLCWLERASAGPEARRLALVMVVFFSLKSIITLTALLDGVFSVWGWAILASDVPMFLIHASIVFGWSPERRREVG